MWPSEMWPSEMWPGNHPVLRLVLHLWSRAWGCLGPRGECGGAVLEVAVICAFFIPPLLLGTAEMGTLVYDSIEVANAAEVATAYGMQSLTYASNTSGITTAAQTEASDFGTALSVTPTTYYACSNALGGTHYTTQASANSACTGTGNHALEFVQVKTSATVTPSIHCPGLPASYTLVGSSVMEVEQ